MAPFDGYKKTTRIVHGAARTGRWDYSHHVVPPLTASATFRLESVKQRGGVGRTRQDGGQHGALVVMILIGDEELVEARDQRRVGRARGEGGAGEQDQGGPGQFRHPDAV